MNRRAPGAIALLLGVAAVTIAAVRSELRPWVGTDFRTEAPSLLRPLYGGVTFTPILTVGDSLLPPTTEEEGFLFLPLPSGIGVQPVGRGLAEIYVSHGTSWEDGVGGGRVSRLLLEAATRRVVAADWIVDGEERLERLGGGTLATTREGFLTPQFLVGESSLLGPNRGVVAAVSARSGHVTALPWLGRFRHAKVLPLPISNGRLITILTESGDPGTSQLYMFLTQSDTDFMAGQGQLFVFRADPPREGPDTQLASMVKKTRPLTGRFVPVQGFTVDGDATNPAAVELSAQAARALRFARLGGAALDRWNPGAFYFADQGDANWIDPVSGRPVTGDGRVYRMELDAFDPTVVKDLRLVLDGDDAEDLYRPKDLETDDRGLLIQESPGRRGIHPSRILRWEFNSRRLDPLAECAERDPQGRLIPQGTGGLWETAGVVDASGAFGPGTWLVSVKAPNDYSSAFRGRGGGGQLLLMRTPVWGEVAKKRKAESPEKAPSN